MACVRRCDICGKIFDAPGDIFVSYGHFSFYTSKHDFGEGTDCCPECTDKVKGFIDALKSGEPVKIYIGEIECDATCQG